VHVILDHYGEAAERLIITVTVADVVLR